MYFYLLLLEKKWSHKQMLHTLYYIVLLWEKTFNTKPQFLFSPTKKSVCSAGERKAKPFKEKNIYEQRVDLQPFMLASPRPPSLLRLQDSMRVPIVSV